MTNAEVESILEGPDGSEPGMGTSIPESRRPALRVLSQDVEELVDDLVTGFRSREEVLRWSRRCIPRTLGEIPTRWYREFSEQFRSEPADGHERALMSVLLVGSARSREIDEEVVEEVRQRLAVSIVEPAYHRAFRELRNSATEYVDAEGESGSAHDPNRQRYVAMRPVLDEFDRYQRVALDALLEGFDDVDDLRRWGEVLELATHGELEDGFIERIVAERSTRSLLLESDPTDAQERARELFAAYYLLPAFNRGIRDLRERSKEEPDANRQEKEVSSI